MYNLDNLDLFEILITQKLQKCPKDPFARSALIFLLDLARNYIRQIVDIPMGTYCAPLVADLFLFCYERDFMKYLS